MWELLSSILGNREMKIKKGFGMNDQSEEVTKDEIIKRISEALQESSGLLIESISNQVLSNQVSYIEDSLFYVHKVE